MLTPTSCTRFCLTIFILAALGLAGCFGDETTSDPTAVPTAPDGTTVETPPLPPVESMAVDFTAFGGGSLGAGLLAPPAPDFPAARGVLALPGNGFPYAASGHFQEAQDRVDTWNGIIYFAFVVPVTVFISAIDLTPAYQGDLTWLWEYSEVVGLQTWTANLTASVSLEPAEVTWSMRVTSAPKVLGCCTNFEWFRGVHSSATSGFWQFFRYAPRRPGRTAEAVRVDWAVTTAADLSLTFTNNSELIPSSLPWGEGSYLQYGNKGETLSLTSKNSARNNPVVITLNTTTNEGSIVYRDGTKGCWDTNQADTPCP